MFGLPLRWFDRPGFGYPAMLADLVGEMSRRSVRLETGLTCSGAGTGTWWTDPGRPAAALAQAFAQDADLVTVTLGANDMLRRWVAYVPSRHVLGRLGVRGTARDRAVDLLAPALTAVRTDAADVERRLGGMLRWLRDRLSCPVCVTTYYGGDDARIVHDRFVRPLNDAIRAAAATAPGVTVVDLEPVFRGRGVEAPADRRLVDLSDVVHPTKAGQVAIAAAIARELPPLERQPP